MSEVTPDMIAAFASRIYNEVPNANFVPHTESEVPTTIPEPVGTPAAPAFLTPEHFAKPTPAIPALSTHSPTIPDNVTNVSTPYESSHTLQNSPSGLREFVRKVQMTGLSTDSKRCATDFGQDEIQRIFRKKHIYPNTDSVYPSRPFDVSAIRRDFPILQQQVHGKPLAWLDNAATTQKPQSVIDTISHFYSHDNSNIHRGAHTLAARATDAYENARKKVQEFIGAESPNNIIFVRGTTEGINLVTQTYGRKFLQPGDEILLSILEHHANIVPWQMIAKEKGIVIKVIPVNDRGEVMMEEYQRLLGPRTKLVALAHANNSLGTLLPIAEMTQMAKRYNATVLVDGAQTVAHIPVDVKSLNCDFFVFSGHKVFGPTGIGVVYAKQELLELMPPYQGGGNMIRNVTFEETTYSEPPAKFEAGTPNIADAVGLGAAIDYVNQLGRPNIAKYEHELLHYATEQLSRINGLKIIGTAREKIGVLSFVLDQMRSEDVGRLLDMEGIAVRSGHHCAQPSLRRFGVEATVRPSFSIYNTMEEVDRLARAVKSIQRK